MSSLPPPPPEVQPARAAARVRRTATVVIALAAFVVGVGAGIALPIAGPTSASPEPAGSPSPTAAPLADAYDLCNVADAGGEIADEQTTLILDAQGTDDATGVDYPTITCVLTQLGAPERVTQTMDSTRALDGRLSDSWDSFTAGWSYHPDTGLDLVISTP